jgi:hypothetical protein
MMSNSQHIERHKELHKAFDELLADYLLYSKKVPGEIPVFELMKWSYQQTLEPQEEGLHR